MSSKTLLCHGMKYCCHRCLALVDIRRLACGLANRAGCVASARLMLTTNPEGSFVFQILMPFTFMFLLISAPISMARV